MATVKKKAVKKPAPKAKAKTPVKVKLKPKAAAKPAPKAAAKPVPKAAAKPVAKPAAKPVVAAKPVAAKPAPVPQKPVLVQARPAAAAAPVAAAPKPAAAPAAAPPAPRKVTFKPNELVVYPAHGVGKVVMIEEQEIAGIKLELYIIDFEKEKLRLKVPTNKADQKGMRRLADRGMIDQAMRTLRGRARIKRTMWSRRAQEYEAKINSGDMISVAEVVRDLYRSERQPEQSYSERQLFEQALDRMAREIAAVKKIDDDVSIKEISDFLSKNAHKNVKAAEEDLAAEEAA